MYKKHKSPLEKSKGIFHWIKKRILFIIAAFMIGMSNVIYEEHDTIRKKYFQIEQEEEKKD